MVYELSTAAELLTAVKGLSDSPNRPLFRGQGRDWPLLPKAWRSGYKDVDPDARLDEWLDKARTLGRVPADRWKQLALAQHHGLATPLLDWSTNPLVALYFAVEDPATSKADGVLWCFEPVVQFDPTKDKLGTPASYTFALSLGRTRKPFLALLMPEFTRRIYCQYGAFTYSGADRQRMDALEWPYAHEVDDGTTRTESLTSYRIPADSKESMREELARCGMTHSRLFPDLDGLSEEMNRSRLWAG